MGNDKMKREMKCNTDDMFYFFLNWLADEKGYSGSDIAFVVYKYWKHEKLWIEFNEHYDKETDKLWEESK